MIIKRVVTIMVSSISRRRVTDAYAGVLRPPWLARIDNNATATSGVPLILLRAQLLYLFLRTRVRGLRRRMRHSLRSLRARCHSYAPRDTRRAGHYRKA